MSTTNTITYTFDDVGQYQLDIHPDAYNINVELEGGGGAGAPGNDNRIGGDGGYVGGELPQASGETLTIFVGGGGGIENESGGFNGGGNGWDNFVASGGGGGASDIRIGGTTLDDRAAVAAGGGGAAVDDENNNYVHGGDGGGLEGEDGDSSTSGNDGGGGTQTEGGSSSFGGNIGSFGSGGDGQDTDYPGGGGGGGWYGGGGGDGNSFNDFAAAGGGGSSYIDGLQNATTTTGGGGRGGVSNEEGGDGSVTITYEIDVESVADLEVTGSRDTEIDKSWLVTDTNVDGHRIYRSDEPGVNPEDATQINDVLGSVESHTDDGLLNGTSYYYLLESYIELDFGEEATAFSAEISGQTTIPNVDDFELDSSEQDELAVQEIISSLNTGQYRIRWKRSGSADYDGNDEVVIPFNSNPLEYTISPVLDGNQYDVGVRTESDEIVSDWLTANEITKLVPVSGITFKPVDETVPNHSSDLNISWTIESDYEGEQVLYRLETTGDATGLGDEVTTLNNETEAYTDGTDFQPGRDYVYTVRTETQYVHADSSETFVTSRAGLQAALYAEIDDPTRTDPITIDPPKAIQNATIRHSATSNVDISTQDLGPELRTLAQANPDVDLRTRLIDSTGQEVRDDRIIKGVLGEVETEGQSDEATLKTKGRGWYLENGTPDVPYHAENIQVWEAIVDYAEQHLSDWDVEVIPDPGQPIATDEVAQSPSTDTEWNNLLNQHLADTDPVLIDSGTLKQTPCSFTFDEPGPESVGSADTVFSDYYSSGRGMEFSSVGDDRVFDPFEVKHTLSAANIGVAVRPETPFASDGQNATVELQLVDASDDTEVHSLPIYEGNQGSSALWHGFGADGISRDLVSSDSEWTGSDVPPGEYYFRLECTNSPTGDGGPTVIDIFSVFDSRFSYDWDDQLHEEDGYLDGPEPFPTVSFELPLEERETNIDAARIESIWNDTSGEQAIALSNDNGLNWIEQSNTNSLDVNFAENQLFGTQLRARFTFSGHPYNHTPQDETPRFRYNPQSVDSYELRFDQSSVAVINDSIFSDSHKENLNTLVERGRMYWVIDHTADGKALKVFPIGTENGGVGWTTKDWSRSDGSFQYANRVVARGARKPEEERENEDDLRYEGEVTDDEEIQQRLDDGLPADKATVTRTILDPELETQEEVNQQAFNALEDYVEARLASGSVDVVPTFIPPGYAYEVPEFEDENGETPTKVLEQVSISMGYDSATGTLQFEEPQNWVTALNPIEGDVGGLKRLF